MPSAINSDNGVVSGTAGLKSSADSSGVLDLQTNGTTAISISASQVVSFANQPTYTGGTANGVMFLNGSKAVTTGTALTFDGTNLSVGAQGEVRVYNTANTRYGRFVTTSAGTLLQSFNGAGEPLILDAPQASAYISFNVNSIEQMRLNTTGLGIGTNSPAEKLHVNSGTGNVPALFESTDPIAVIQFKDNNSTLFNAVGVQTNSLIFYSGDNVNMRLDQSGNLGLGTTPSAWGGPFDVLQLGTYGQHIGGQTNTADLKIGTNNYYNGSNYVYTVTGYTAMQMNLGQGVFNVSAAPSGTAGATASLTQIIAVASGQSLALQGATSQSGTGITFPATQAASSDANTLDDYEEGTFSVAIAPSSGAFGAVTYNANNVAYYTKVGRLVSVTGIVWVSSYTTGTASGRMFFSLPFAALNGTQNFAAGVVMQFGGNGYTPSIATANVATRVEQGAASFSLGVDNNTVYTDEQIGTFSTSGFLFRFNVTYVTT
jgi:hypothetical protein